MTRDFDRYSDSYRSHVERAVGFARQGLDFYTEAKVQALVTIASRRLGPLERLAALDVGCGTGEADRLLASSLGQLDGVDVSNGLLETASRTNPGVNYHLSDGLSLPFPDRSFDICFAFCVLHHVPRERRGSFASEMCRLTRPGGIVVVAEHNPLNPLTRLAVARCEFDKDAVLLSVRETERTLTTAGLSVCERRYILFFPWRTAHLRRLEGFLGRIPLGAQYLVAATG